MLSSPKKKPSSDSASPERHWLSYWGSETDDQLGVTVNFIFCISDVVVVRWVSTKLSFKSTTKLQSTHAVTLDNATSAGLGTYRDLMNFERKN